MIMAASRSTVRRFQPFHRVRCSDRNVAHRSNPPGHHLAILHFDFWQGDDPCPRGCPHGLLHRPVDPKSDQTDNLDRLAFEARQ
jgi:hypothetical protein